MSMQPFDPLTPLQVQVYLRLDIAGLDVSISNTVVFMLLAVAIATLLLRWMVLPQARVPGRAQLLAEIFYTFIAGLTRSNIHRHSEQYVPAMFAVFIFILACNLIGLVPGAFTPTAQIAVTGTMALAIFAYTTGLRIRLHGWHFFLAFAPKGVPALLLPLIIPIEILSYMARPVTLAVRLFANMTAGHTALVAVAFLGLGTPLLASWIPLAFGAAQIALEIMIAFIQAYIFTILSCVYIDDALEQR